MAGVKRGQRHKKELLKTKDFSDRKSRDLGFFDSLNFVLYRIMALLRFWIKLKGLILAVTRERQR
jgi:hypothetical protein